MTKPGSGPTPPPVIVDAGAGLAQALNASCRCMTIDAPRLEQALAQTEPALYSSILAHRPHLLSPTAVFIAQRDIGAIRRLIDAIELVIAHPGYREHALAWAPAIAAHEPAARGVFLGYDFHLAAGGPRLIEINTNAGGGMLNVVLARAQRVCCPEVATMIAGGVAPQRLEEAFIDMFRAEWRLARGDTPLRTVAIVDDRPEEQYLYPDFKLIAESFRHHGIEAVIADPADLFLCHGGLWYGERTRIDLVYNRLTDFALEDNHNAVLREAYLRDAVVLTPHPRAHALYADKRNLTLLSDGAFLRTLALPNPIIETLLAGVPRTEPVDAAHAEALWRDRKQWFFKPASGYGSRATYRGDKLTRRVFEEILHRDYIVQARVDPPARAVQPAGERSFLKFDIRAYVYTGAVQLLAARLYQGQTTNFRTAGGGFAPVYHTPT